jgi:hypothetical protein
MLQLMYNSIKELSFAVSFANRNYTPLLPEISMGEARIDLTQINIVADCYKPMTVNVYVLS